MYCALSIEPEHVNNERDVAELYHLVFQMVLAYLVNCSLTEDLSDKMINFSRTL